MSDSKQTVFISYRRSVASFIARAIFMDLREHGYDAFMDVESIDSGQFDSIILNQIAARTHFVLILTPGSAERFANEGDWLRREVEHAMELKRNIVPVLAYGFTFATNEQYFTGKLADLPRYNALTVPHEFFDPAMEKLRTRFLRQSMQGTIQPVPDEEQQIAEQKIEKAVQESLNNSEPPGDDPRAQIVQDYTELIKLDPSNPNYYVDRGLALKDMGQIEQALADYSQAIALDPNHSGAYNNRGNAYYAQGEYEQAIADYNRALEIDPQNAYAFHNRGLAFKAQGGLEQALADFNKAIEIDDNYASALVSRGMLYSDQGDKDAALIDYGRALELDPTYAIGYNNRGNIFYGKQEYERALEDYNRAIEINPAYAHAHNNRANVYYVWGQMEEALAGYTRAIELQPGYLAAIEGRARTRKALLEKKR